MTTVLCAGKGHGKSKLIGRGIGWQDLVLGTPLVLFDPVGGSIDQLLSKLVELPGDYQRKLASRIVYVNMAGAHKHVVPLPIIYRLEGDSLAGVANRYIDVVRRSDVHLANASVEGLNALIRVAVPTIMILAALGEPITKATSLLDEPQSWQERFSEAINRFPEVVPAVEFFTREYMGWSEQVKARRTESFRVKLSSTFVYNPASRAIYGAPECYRLDWEQVVAKRQTVLLDGRDLYSQEEKRFGFQWAFMGLLDYVRHRGPGHKHRPISIVIDELSALVNVDPAAADLVTADMNELLNVLARNYRLFVTVALQAPTQMDPRIQRALFSCGIQIIGAVPNIDDAIILARTFFPLTFSKPKRFEPIYSSYQGISSVIDYHQVDYTVEEETLQNAYAIMQQRPFHFLARVARREGDVTGSMRRMSIANFDPGRYVNEEFAPKLRAILAERSGVPIETILSTMELRRGTATTATMDLYAQDVQFGKFANENPIPLSASYTGSYEDESYENYESNDEYYPDTK